MRGLWLGCAMAVTFGLGYCLGVLAYRDRLDDAEAALLQLRMRSDIQLGRQFNFPQPDSNGRGYPKGPR